VLLKKLSLGKENIEQLTRSVFLVEWSLARARVGLGVCMRLGVNDIMSLGGTEGGASLTMRTLALSIIYRLLASACRWAMLTVRGMRLEHPNASFLSPMMNSINISLPSNLALQMPVLASSAFLETQAVILSLPPSQHNFSKNTPLSLPTPPLP
jgi:hypothetical protein